MAGHAECCWPKHDCHARTSPVEDQHWPYTRSSANGRQFGDGSQPKNEEAYDLFLRSTAVPHEPAPNKEAIRCWNERRVSTPSYAPAWDALGQRYYFDAAYSDGGQAALDRSNAALERAKALDPNLVSAVVTLATNWVERGGIGKGLHGSGTGSKKATRKRLCAFRALLCLALCRSVEGGTARM